MRRVGRGQHDRPRRRSLLGHIVMHVGRRQQAETRMMVLGVVPGEEWVRASWIEPNRSGNAGRYFSVLNWASENGLSLDTCKPGMGLGHAQIGQEQRHGLRARGRFPVGRTSRG